MFIYYQNCPVFNCHLSGNKFLYFLYIVIIYLIMHYPLLVDTVKCLEKPLDTSPKLYPSLVTVIFWSHTVLCMCFLSMF